MSEPVRRIRPIETPEPLPPPEPRQKHGGGHEWWRELWTLLVFAAGVFCGAYGWNAAQQGTFAQAERAVMQTLSISDAIKSGR